MFSPSDTEGPKVLLGQVLTFNSDPSNPENEHSFSYWERGFISIENGLISNAGKTADAPDGSTVVDYGDCLICAGFVDAHVHYPQIDVIASYGTQLLEWLDKYTFPEEARFSNKEVADKAAAFFLDELLKNGFTTAAVYCTSHPVSVDAFFEESSRRNLRVVAGKVLMDRNVPISVRDTAKTGYDQSKALIDKWHGRGRNLYAVTPRFAPTSSPEQLELAGALYKSADGVFVQSHVSENLDEVSWVNELFPDADSYLDVYSHFGLLGPRALYGHGIHFSDSEIALAAETGAAIVHCPTSNLFMGSGLFQFERLKNSEVLLAFGTDIAGGTSLSPFATMKGAYEISQLQGYSISPEEAFYTATLGGAKAMHLDDRIGRIATGYEADLVVIDLKSTPMIENRTNRADNLGDLLFAQIVLADDRAIRATYAAGNLVYDRKVLLDNPIKG
ncbi:MAG TPA: guanine deaminase [Rhodospirillales bacterium]|nr:guanine deaminase [Rhodospirillales bacterium]